MDKKYVDYARASMKVSGRYDNEGRGRDGEYLYFHKEWSSRQLKRMRKQRNKYRRRFGVVGLWEKAE